MELYHFWDSPCCFKARLALAEKGVEWTERYIMTVRFDHFQPDYAALNPHCKVPTLVHDEHVVIQSSNIAAYVDEAFDGISLQPASPAGRATMRQWMADEDETLFPLVVTMSFNLMMKLRAEGFGLDKLREWSTRHPDRDRAADYLNRVTGPPDMAAVAAADAQMARHLDRLDGHLAAGGPFICGDYSLADLSVAPILDRLEYLDRMPLIEDRPEVAAWYGRVKERPSWAAAAPPFAYRMWGPKKPVPPGGVDADAAGNTFPAA